MANNPRFNADFGPRRRNSGDDNLLTPLPAHRFRPPQLPLPPKPPVLDHLNRVTDKRGDKHHVCDTCGAWDRNTGFHFPGCGYLKQYRPERSER